MKKNYIIIPTYNDWKSLNRLLQILNNRLGAKRINTNILLVNDCSKDKFIINKTKLKNINNLIVINLKKNVGSQRAIFTGLKYLLEKTKKANPNSTVSILDSDGEDNPKKLIHLINFSNKEDDFFIFANRAHRTESFFLKFLNKIRLYFTYILTGYYINFGNFSSFPFKILKILLSNDNLHIAFSSGVLKNYKNIKLLDIEKNRRFNGYSKVNFNFLINHSIRIISVFYERVFLRSIITLFIILGILNESESKYLYIYIFLILNVITFLYNKLSKPSSNVIKNIKNTKIIKGKLI